MNMRFSLAITRLDRIRNEHTCKGDISQMEQFSDIAMRGEAEMVWTSTNEGLGYMFTWKRYWGWNCQVGEREGGRGEDILMLIVREDMLLDDRGEWRAMIHCGDP